MKRKLAFLLAAVMLLCVCCTACGKGADSEDRKAIVTPTESAAKKETVTVPKFIGKMYYTEVENVEEYDHNFNLQIKWENAHDPEIKMGEVFKQDPAAGKTITKGATVILYVNSATPKDIALDVRAEIEGAHKNDVRKLLQDAGFVVKEITSSSDQVEADYVIGININKGQSYPYGTVVTMVVSTGPSQMLPITFPAIIIGEQKETAEEILKTYGFVGTIAYVEQNYSDDRYAEKGTVMGVMVDGVLMETLPDEINPAADLTLVVSSGFSLKVEVPDLRGWEEARARLELERQGFVVEILKIRNSNYKEGLVDKTHPQAGFIAETGSTVTLMVSSQTPTAPSFISEEEALAITIEHYGMESGYVDPATGFPISYLVMDLATEEDPYYRVAIRWFVDGSHYSVVDWVYVDAFTGEVLSNHP